MKPELNNINNIVGLEVPLWSDEYRLKGRCDCIAEYKGHLTLIDFKTSKKHKKRDWVESYFIQATAYAQMVNEHTDLKINNVALIFGISNFNVCNVFESKTQNHIKELNRINNEYNK